MTNNNSTVATPPGIDPKGKNCIITGGAGGIGSSLARILHKEGAKNIILADKVDSNKTAKEVLGKSYTLDVGSKNEMKKFIQSVQNEFGQIDIFFGNAGIANKDDHTISEERWNQIWQVNVAQHMYAARELIPGMLNRGSGWFVITASAAGLLSQVGSVSYSTTKHAAVGFAEWLAITYGDRGIGTSVLCPQGVRTAMTAAMKNGGVAGIDGMLEPEEVANITIKSIKKGIFLITPHNVVREYQKLKIENPERWIKGMRKLYKKYGDW